MCSVLRMRDLTCLLEVEEDQLAKEAPCYSMQMHKDVVHCGPDHLLPGGALHREPGVQLLPGKKPTLPCLTSVLVCISLLCPIE